MISCKIAAAFLLVLQAAQEPQSAIEVQTTLAPDSVRIGERITLNLYIDGVPADAQVIFPVMSDTGLITALGPPLILADRGDGSRSAQYELAAWDVGELVLPATQIQIITDDSELEIPLPDVTVRVISVLPADASADTLPWRPPSDVVGGNWSLAEELTGVGLALAIMLAVAIYARRRGVSLPVPIPPGPVPRDRALDALRRLAESGLAEGGEMKAFYSYLSQIVREFIAGSGEAWGLDLTTNDIAAALAAAGVAQEEQDVLRQVLDTADTVKFARVRPRLGQALWALQKAEGWVKHFEPPVVEPQPEDDSEQEETGDEAALAFEELFAIEMSDASESDDEETERS